MTKKSSIFNKMGPNSLSSSFWFLKVLWFHICATLKLGLVTWSFDKKIFWQNIFSVSKKSSKNRSVMFFKVLGAHRTCAPWYIILLPLCDKIKKPATPDFFKDLSFHVSFHVKFGIMRCCDFSINNPQNSCFVKWLLMWNITFWVKYSIKKSFEYFVKTQKIVWQKIASLLVARESNGFHLKSIQIFKGDFKKTLALLCSIDCHLMIC